MITTLFFSALDLPIMPPLSDLDASIYILVLSAFGLLLLMVAKDLTKIRARGHET